MKPDYTPPVLARSKAVLLGAESLTLRIVIGFVLVFAAIVVSEVLPERAKRVLQEDIEL